MNDNTTDLALAHQLMEEVSEISLSNDDPIFPGEGEGAFIGEDTSDIATVAV